MTLWSGPAEISGSVLPGSTNIDTVSVEMLVPSDTCSSKVTSPASSMPRVLKARLGPLPFRMLTSGPAICTHL